MCAAAEPDSSNQQFSDIRPWKLVVRSVVLLLLVFAVALVVRFFGLPIEELGIRAAERGGLVGVFCFVYLVDTFVVPASLDLLFPVTMGVSPVPLLLVMSTASILGGLSGYWIGRLLCHFRYINRTVAGYRARGEGIISRFGVWAVVLAGVTPIPFSTISWIAGMVRMPVGLYLLGALSRAPRIVVYYLLFRTGLALFV